jgi:hypothetical protein
MRTSTAFSLLLTFLATLSLALEPEKGIDIEVWPLSATKSLPYAKISYNSTKAVIKSHSNPAIPPNDDFVRIGFHHSDSGEWSGILTSPVNFAASKDKKIVLHVNRDGEAYHVGFKASELATNNKMSNKDGDLSVEVVQIRMGPTPHLNRPVVVNPDGSMPQKEPEKTFFQKYVSSFALGLERSDLIFLQILVGYCWIRAAAGGHERWKRRVDTTEEAFHHHKLFVRVYMTDISTPLSIRLSSRAE